MSNVEKELNKLLLKQREELFIHHPLEHELSFYRTIQNGDMEEINKIIASKSFSTANHQQPSDNASRTGILSNDPLRNEKYHYIVMIAMITRFCIEGGLDSETAYTLSDLFIQKADIAKSITEMLDLKRQVVIEYSNKMNKLKTIKIPSKPVVLAIEYIEKNIATELKPISVANYVSKDISYLTKLFKTHLSMTLNEYIQYRKIETSKYILENSNISSTEISTFLHFSSASHFITVFKKYAKITPTEYRKRVFRNAVSGFI